MRMLLLQTHFSAYSENDVTFSSSKVAWSLRGRYILYLASRSKSPTWHRIAYANSITFVFTLMHDTQRVSWILVEREIDHIRTILYWNAEWNEESVILWMTKFLPWRHQFFLHTMIFFFKFRAFIPSFQIWKKSSSKRKLIMLEAWWYIKARF